MATQKDLESKILQESTCRYINRETTKEQKGQAHRTKWGSSTIRQLIEPLSAGLSRWVETAASRPGRMHEALPLAQSLDADKMAWLTLTTVISGCMRPRTQTAVAIKIGTAINNECIFEQVASDKPYAFRRLSETAAEATKRNPKISKSGDMLRSIRRMNLMPALAEWSTDQRLKIGLLMLELLISNTGIVELSAPPGDRKALQVTPSQRFLEFIDRVKGRLDLLKPVHQPMIEQPRDWTGMHGGGYHTPEMQYPLVKTKWNMKGDAPELTQTVLDSANVHQRVPWVVNGRVLEVLKACLELGVSVAGVPPLEPKPLPPRPPSKGPELSMWKLNARDIWIENNEAKCTRAALAGIVCLADEYIKYPAIWFPVQLDFRGRSYYVPSGLNPQGTDVSKALLDYATPTPLGHWGALMLMIRAANTYANGVDKLSYMERIEWCLKSEDSLMSTGRDPIGTTFWRSAKKPFQFMRACLELHALTTATGASLCEITSALMEHSVPSTLGKARHQSCPTTPLLTAISTFASHCVFRIDASCSGIQHFSALTRDRNSGGMVNVLALETTCTTHTGTLPRDCTVPTGTSGCSDQRDCPSQISALATSDDGTSREDHSSLEPCGTPSESDTKTSRTHLDWIFTTRKRPVDAYLSVAESLFNRLITLEASCGTTAESQTETHAAASTSSASPSLLTEQPAGTVTIQSEAPSPETHLDQKSPPSPESLTFCESSSSTMDQPLSIPERLMCQKWLTFGIADRDLTKRQTMVLTYGSTFKACMDYTTAAVVDMAKKKRVPIPGEDKRIQYIAFLSKHLWAVMHETIKGPMDCMDWLRACSDVLSKEGKPVQWTAPNGFVVRQRYLSVASRRVSLMTGDKVIKVSVREPTNKLDSRKSANSTVPNCIHSFDAAYKDFLAIEMANAGWDFASNHDEFCSPMGGGADLFYHTREQMTKIYTTDWLQILYQNFCEQASDPTKIPEPPPLGDLKIEDIRSAYYICS